MEELGELHLGYLREAMEKKKFCSTKLNNFKLAVIISDLSSFIAYNNINIIKFIDYLHKLAHEK
ncbi:hypothetical protein KAI52_00500 [Candidatus Parcubacteria bacterium]|nr:hypothetical protein [Candidatus Parcubacteria bacterium]